MSDTLIKVEGVSKKFSRNLKRSMFYGANDILAGIIGRYVNTNQLRPKEFWVLKEISFQLNKGECIGIIGFNGAGKSTLLKILSGIISPDQGKVTVKGRTGVLIEVGAGFHPMLTGRENIYVNASILGLSTKEISKRFDQIVAFSGLEEFLDTPIKNYSSGMYVRLGFSIAVHLNPDILFIDEVLAVGDIQFQSLCRRKINELITNGTAIILVSHQMSLIDKLSNRVLLLEHNNKYSISKPQQAIDRYYKILSQSGHNGTKHDHDTFEITGVRIFGINNSSVTPGKPFTILVEYNCKEAITAHPNFAIHPGGGEQIAACRTDRDGHGPVKFNPGKGCFEINIEKCPFTPGSYSVSIRIFDIQGIEPLVNHQAYYPFTIQGGADTVGYIHLLHKWKFNK